MILLSGLASPMCEERWLSHCHQGISPENGAGSLVQPTSGRSVGGPIVCSRGREA